MSLSIAEVPGMTQWQLNRMRETLPAFKTIGDVLAHQDPGTELRKIHQVGQRRAEKILKVITNFVEEFLS
jgi:ERCC4-type nuclease